QGVSAKIHAREFGKLAPYLRYKGCQPRERLVAVTREPRLFNQNIGGRQIERLCTAAEACPVLVSESRFQPDEGPVNGGGNYDPRPRGSQNSAICGNIRESLRTAAAVTMARCGQSAGKAGCGVGRRVRRWRRLLPRRHQPSAWNEVRLASLARIPGRTAPKR